MIIRLFIVIIIGFCSFNSFSQTGFHFKKNKKKEQIKFKLINNLIIIPIEINGENLSFILDTGVNKTILFTPSKKDSIHFSNLQNNMLRGLGEGKSVPTIISTNNTLRIKNLTSSNENIYVTINNPFDFSQKLGMTVHGIIGYSIFKNFLVKINYKSKKITFYNPKKYNYRKCKKCVTKPIEFNKNKPYINAQISLDSLGKNLIDIKLLIDSGGSDAIWLFENSKKNIKTPHHYFHDILGEGISGYIFGNRSRLTKFKLDNYVIKNSTVSFLDSTSTNGTRKFKSRNGSIGGRILKRFTIWLDYPNSEITFKKSGSFSSDFNYNMSGLDIVYNGMQLIKQKEFLHLGKHTDNINTPQSVVYMYSYKFKPSYRINNVVENSPAYNAGLLKGDIILKMNHKTADKLTLQDIFYLLQERDHKKIKLTIYRNGETIKFEFRLKKVI